jgi:hypothetical protein
MHPLKFTLELFQTCLQFDEKNIFSQSILWVYIKNHVEKISLKQNISI